VKNSIILYEYLTIISSIANKLTFTVRKRIVATIVCRIDISCESYSEIGIKTIGYEHYDYHRDTYPGNHDSFTNT